MNERPNFVGSQPEKHRSDRRRELVKILMESGHGRQVAIIKAKRLISR